MRQHRHYSKIKTPDNDQTLVFRDRYLKISAAFILDIKKPAQGWILISGGSYRITIALRAIVAGSDVFL